MFKITDKRFAWFVLILKIGLILSFFYHPDMNRIILNKIGIIVHNDFFSPILSFIYTIYYGYLLPLFLNID